MKWQGRIIEMTIARFLEQKIISVFYFYVFKNITFFNKLDQ